MTRLYKGNSTRARYRSYLIRLSILCWYLVTVGIRIRQLHPIVDEKLNLLVFVKRMYMKRDKEVNLYMYM